MNTSTDTKVGTSSTGLTHRAFTTGAGIRTVAFANCQTSRRKYGGIVLRNVHSMTADETNLCNKCFIPKA